MTSLATTRIVSGDVAFVYRADNPPDFATDAGTVALCQLIDEHSILDGGSDIITNGYVLDGQFPYKLNVTQVGANGYDDDGPIHPLANLTAFNINCQFATTCIYLPSGTASQYVPLRTRRWSWNSTGLKLSDGTWSTPTGGIGVNPTYTDLDLSRATYEDVWRAPAP